MDFPISKAFLFGRGPNPENPARIIYSFTPSDMSKQPAIYLLYSKIEEQNPGLFPFDIVNFDPFIEMFKDIKFIPNIAEHMKNLRKNSSLNALTKDNLVEQLNSREDLIFNLEKLPHFGTISYSGYIMRSDSEISMIFIPYKSTTLFQIVHYGPKFPKKTGSILKKFFDILISLQ